MAFDRYWCQFGSAVPEMIEQAESGAQLLLHTVCGVEQLVERGVLEEPVDLRW